MTPELQKKVDQAVKLLQVTAGDDVVEVSYSGGKDSDVILELARMSGIKYRAIYKNTTIDPPGTERHAKDNGVEVMMPKHSFFELVAMNGFPNRFARHCCRFLKEYKVLDKNIMGVRKAESVRRAKRYKEPTECRYYGNKKEHVEAIYPILDWSDQDVADFISERGIQCHSLYYDEQGRFHVERRLGCMCCPLASKKQRVEYFRKYPNMVKAYIRAGKKFFTTHTDGKTYRHYNGNIYDWFVRDVFYDNQTEWEMSRNGMFAPEDSKEFLEKYFNIKL